MDSDEEDSLRKIASCNNLFSEDIEVSEIDESGRTAAARSSNSLLNRRGRANDGGRVTSLSSEPRLRSRSVLEASTSRSPTLKQQEKRSEQLQQENFDLKMQVLYLKQKLSKLSGPAPDGDLQGEVVELKLLVEEYRLEMEQKDQLLRQACSGMEMLKEELDNAQKQADPELCERMASELKKESDNASTFRQLLSKERKGRQAAENETNMLRVELGSCQEQRGEAEARVLLQESEIQELNNKVAQVNRKNEELQTQLMTMQHSIGVMKGQASNLEKEKAMIAQLKEESGLEREQLENEKRKAIQMQAASKDLHCELERLKRNLSEEQKKVSSQQARENELYTRLTDAARKEADLTAQMREMKDVAEEAQREFVLAKKCQKDLENDLKSMRATLHKTQETGEQVKSEGEQSHAKLLSDLTGQRDLLRRMESKMEEYKRKAKQGDHDRLKRDHMFRTMMQRWEETLDAFISDVLPDTKSKQEPFQYSPEKDRHALIGEGELVGFVERLRGKLELVRGVKHSLQQMVDFHVGQTEDRVRQCLQQVTMFLTRVDKAEGTLSRVRIFVAGGVRERREKIEHLEGFLMREKDEELRKRTAECNQLQERHAQEKAELEANLETLKSKVDQLNSDACEIKVNHAKEINNRDLQRQEMQTAMEKLEIGHQEALTKADRDIKALTKKYARERDIMTEEFGDAKKRILTDQLEKIKKLKREHYQEIQELKKNSSYDVQAEMSRIKTEAEFQIDRLTQDLQKELQNVKDQKFIAEQKLNKEEEDRQKVASKLRQAENQMTEAEAEIQNLQRKLRAAEDQNIEYEDVCRRLEKTNSFVLELQETNHGLKNEQAKYDSFKKECERHKNTIDRLRTQITQRDKLISKYLEQFSTGQYDNEDVEQLILNQVAETRRLITTTHLLYEEERHRQLRLERERTGNSHSPAPSEVSESRRRPRIEYDGADLEDIRAELKQCLSEMDELIEDTHMLVDRTGHHLDQFMNIQDNSLRRNDLLEKIDRQCYHLLDNNASLSRKLQQLGLDLRRTFRRFKRIEDEDRRPRSEGLSSGIEDLDVESPKPFGRRSGLNTRRAERSFTRTTEPEALFRQVFHDNRVDNRSRSVGHSRPGSREPSVAASTRGGTYSREPIVYRGRRSRAPSQVGSTFGEETSLVGYSRPRAHRTRRLPSNSYSRQTAQHTSQSPVRDRLASREVEDRSFERLRTMDTQVQEIRSRLNTLESKNAADTK